jgi:hypothetical protein
LTAFAQETTPMTKTTPTQWLSAAAALLVMATAAAQQQPPDFSKVEIKTTRLAADFYATIGRAGPNTKIIPGHGPITNRNGLTASRDMMLAVRDKVAVLVSQGKTLEEVIAAKPTAGFDGQVSQGAQSSERFVKWLYAEVKAQQH